jgi:hypothetical protein
MKIKNTSLNVNKSINISVLIINNYNNNKILLFLYFILNNKNLKILI